LDQIGASLLSMARADLERLHLLYGFSGRAVAEHLRTLVSAGDLFPPGDLPSWDNGAGTARAADGDDLRSRFHGTANWATLLEPLARRHYENGVGEIGRFRAFRWVSSENDLVGVAEPDPITLDDLVGYDYQKGILLQNTEQFLAGYPCNNILLYGARGTGKSSLVKALLNAYGGRGLRLVEVARDDMRDFPRIVRELRGRPQRFLLFADDLSYDDAELHYRELKAALEGSVEGRPENVLLYATSNRRHLIKERFRDRDTADDEIHTQDTAQEKLSLADRFGLTLSFAPPTQTEYLRMVETIAARRGMTIDREEIHAAAIRWAALHNIPSGRTARQFVDDLQGAILRNAAGEPASLP
ncbi:MAG: DUF815 domain-containing protein, partial [Chloroflexi bacterium]|nr:DUF815 domain-containing protein [Chloroflexota bacterium]